MDQVTANMAELSGHVSAMTGLGPALSAAVGAPVTGISAVAYGVRRAVALRRAGGRPARAAPAQAAPRGPAVVAAEQSPSPRGGRGGTEPGMIRRVFLARARRHARVSGYRRVARLARALGARGPQSGAGVLARRPEITGRRVLAGAARAGRSTAEGGGVRADVRVGVAEYLDRQGQETGAAPGIRRGQPEPGGQRRRPPQ